ncbi:MAG TPA: acetyltransferase [Pirellulales bacterium]|nr:acetyltransferase [Pirellulales bacterium]
MMDQPLWVIFGAGAQGRITLEVIAAAQPHVDCLLADDNPELVGQTCCERPIIGRSELTKLARSHEQRLIVAIGHNPQRLKIAQELAAMGLSFATVSHPSAVVSPSAEIELGCFIGPLAMVGCGARVGQHTIINSGAIIEHDCAIDDGASLSPGVRLAGRVRVGVGAFIGTGAVLNPRVTIGAGAIIGAGSVVTRSIDPGMVAYGTPAKPIRPVDAQRDWQKLL